MNPYLLAIFIRRFQILVTQSSDLLRIKRPIAVHQIHRTHTALAQQLQRGINIYIIGFGNCHYIDAGFIPLLRTILYHLNSRRNCVNISSNPYQVHRTVFFIQNIFLEIASSYIRHNRNFHIRLVISYHRTDILVITEFPLSEFPDVEQFLGCLIAEFHIIYTGFDICLI